VERIPAWWLRPVQYERKARPLLSAGTPKAFARFVDSPGLAALDHPLFGKPKRGEFGFVALELTCAFALYSIEIASFLAMTVK